MPGWPHVGVGPRSYQSSDERITQRVYPCVNYLDASNLEISVHNGEVTLGVAGAAAASTRPRTSRRLSPAFETSTG